MPKKGRKKSVSCCEPKTCCKVEALITIDERGQIVLPKDVRKKANVKAGDKFAVISCESNGKVCCISLVKAEDFAETIKGMLGPMMREIFK
jgi:AbrB family looped-hinge helix DNA binding protein